ncbi:Uma2 family endonuclease [Chlorogloeopsis sp. ULAP01]|uniref:Uma2 family endonuclease n=1 Tax=Chlorogloeopsis sp. ULAP01 TaxID=3056483 RepID=UPI0025AB3219|nr:Uma2 family endonuclease [Chlorogloeopsis sp. ULAP01]MDM9382870.1 Uma2 family endonuclease [Chlorogloeopsis sp. ULAP01]
MRHNNTFEADWQSWSMLWIVEKEKIISRDSDSGLSIKQSQLGAYVIARLKCDYLANGLCLGWLIYPYTPLVEIYRPNQDVETFYFSEQTPPTLPGESVLPGFMLDLAPVFNL